jgi:hypothetical protein
MADSLGSSSVGLVTPHRTDGFLPLQEMQSFDAERTAQLSLPLQPA